MGWQSHLLLLRRKTRRRVARVPEGIKQRKVKDSGHGRLGVFRSQNRKNWDNTHKTATPKVKKGVVQAAVEEDSKSNDEDKYKVLPS